MQNYLIPLTPGKLMIIWYTKRYHTIRYDTVIRYVLTYVFVLFTYGSLCIILLYTLSPFLISHCRKPVYSLTFYLYLSRSWFCVFVLLFGEILPFRSLFWNQNILFVFVFIFITLSTELVYNIFTYKCTFLIIAQWVEGSCKIRIPTMSVKVNKGNKYDGTVYVNKGKLIVTSKYFRLVYKK